MVAVARYLALSLLLALPAVQATSLQFSRQWIEIEAPQRSVSMYIRNTGDQPQTVFISTRVWGQGPDDAELVVYPRETRLNPGQRQILRLLVRSRTGPPMAEFAPPRFFRLELEGKPDQPPEPEVKPEEGATYGKITMPIVLSLPVSYVRKGAKAKPAGTIVRDKKGKPVSVLITNSGDAALRLREFRRGKGKAPLTGTVLPGESLSFRTGGKQPPYIFRAEGIPEFTVR